jgi:hypothetical protein
MQNFQAGSASAQAIPAGPRKTRRRLTPTEQIQAAKAALQRAQGRQRAYDARSKIILGGLILSWVRQDVNAAQTLLHHINSHPPRRQDIDALTDIRNELMRLVRSPGNDGNHHHDA